MIKIRKVSLENFKGVKEKTAFQFETDVNVMSGPNGFGKTTIFDAIEICLTGEFKRVEYFDHVQKKTTSRNKPFFQNTDGEDVVLKLWLYETISGANYIIIKHYDDDVAPKRSSRGRDFIPADSENLLVTYLTTDIAGFETNDFTNLSPVNQAQINEIFFGVNSIINLKSSYYLFNYIQQEDSIYFLRKNEDEKGASLGFLFNIEREEAEKDKLSRLRDYLTSQQTSIQGQIDQLRETLPNAQKGEYHRLFPQKSFEFDKEYPFSQVNPTRNQLTPYTDIVDSLNELKNKFIPEEYEKSLRFKKLNEEVLDDQSILNAILIKNVYSADLLLKLEATNLKIAAAVKFIRMENTSFIQKDTFDLFLPSPDEYATYTVIENSVRAIDKDLGDIGLVISELNASRKQVVEKFNQINHTEHISDKNCPLCDIGFESFENLVLAISAKTALLESFNIDKLRQKSRLEEEIKLFHARLSESANDFIRSNKATDQTVFALLREYPSLKDKVDALFLSYPILRSSAVESIYFTLPPKDESDVKGARSLLREFLVEALSSQFAYNDQLIENKHLYIEYFNADPNLFFALSFEMLTAKLQYIQGSYSQLANSRLVFLEARRQRLFHILERITAVFDRVHKTIQEHKAGMIEKIRIPFYIYSGKILQSYQQGLGIFVQIHSTGLSNNVLFKTGHSSNHDIVYHLSSGQMAVVSLAFCLSLNKVYNTNEKFKFLSMIIPVKVYH